MYSESSFSHLFISLRYVQWTIRLCSNQPTLSSRKESFQLNDFDFRSALCATEHDHRIGKTVPVTCMAKML